METYLHPVHRNKGSEFARIIEGVLTTLLEFVIPRKKEKRKERKEKKEKKRKEKKRKEKKRKEKKRKKKRKEKKEKKKEKKRKEKKRKNKTIPIRIINYFHYKLSSSPSPSPFLPLFLSSSLPLFLSSSLPLFLSSSLQTFKTRSILVPSKALTSIKNRSCDDAKNNLFSFINSLPLPLPLPLLFSLSSSLPLSYKPSKRDQY
jgi:chromatin remodeling complex protein RSC6